MSDMGRTEAEDYLYHEAQLLDERRWDEWLMLWAPTDVELWMPIPPDATDRDTAASMLQDDRERLEQRIGRLQHPGLHSQLPPSRTSRIVGNVRCDSLTGGDVRLMSQFHLAEFRPGNGAGMGVSQLLAGTMQHHLRRIDGNWLIYFKKIGLISVDGNNYHLQNLL